MKSPTKRHAKRIIRSDKRHRETLALFGIVSMLVVACVAFAFRLNGRAQTHEVQVLECPVTGTVAHHHDKACYDEEGNLVCKLPELDAHVHTDACYAEETTLVCGLEETPAHYHDDSCYDEEGNLICGLDETPGHVHSDACYKTTRTLACGQQETTEHVHGPGCFVTYEVSDTMPAQTFEHVFTDKHDRQVFKVFVDAPEDALPDGATMEAKWVSAKKLDTELVEKAIAKKTKGKMLDFQAVDITFYDVTGAEIEPQKDVTVTFTSDLIDTDDKPVVVHVESEKEAIARGEAQGKSEVEIEADVVDQLSEKELKKRDVKLGDDELAFDSDQFSTYVLAVTSLQKKMKATDDSTVTVVVSAPAEAGIPQDASLQVTEIASDTDEYADYQARATQAMGTLDAQVAVARFFDITIVDGEGKAIQPQAPVTVKTKLTDAADLDDAKTEVAVVHFGEQDELMDAKESNGVSTFKTDGFSVYGFVYTVDFHYEVDGQEYEYNLAGGDVVTLSELLQAMGLMGSNEAADFVSKVADVQLSDPSLVVTAKLDESMTAGQLKQALGVEPEYSAQLTSEQRAQMDAKQLAEGDWALVALKSFDTTETLTITMDNGDQFQIAVTDARIMTNVLTADGKTYEVSVTYDEKAGIPEDAQLKVDEILPGSKEYDVYHEQAVKAAVGEEAYEESLNAAAETQKKEQESGTLLDKLANAVSSLVGGTADDDAEAADDQALIEEEEYARFFDISILSDGKQVEPKANVQVDIKLLDAPVSPSVKPSVVHFAQDGLEVMKVNEPERDGSEDVVSFETNEFSVYSIVYTVDFHYNVDGKSFTYSIPGGTAVSLRELLPVIGVVTDDADTKIDEVQKFDEQIVDVTFSDDSLVRVAHPESDITLKELKDQLGVTGIISAAYAVEELNGAPELQGIDDGAYVIDPSAGDTDGLSFTAPEVDEMVQPVAAEPQVEEETVDEADAGATDTEESEEPTITVITDDDVIKAGTWVLISLKPFTSDELLTVSMKNGDVFTVQVTDQQGNSYDVYFDGTLGQGSQRNQFYNGASNVHTLVNLNGTVTLPSVGTSFGSEHVTAPIATGYSYTLKGWYDIKNKKYYAPGETVRITEDTIFYADWIASTYSKGSDYGTIDTPSTLGFVTTEVFDYNELINVSKLNVSVNVGNLPYNQGWGHTDTWSVPNGSGDKYFNFISWNYNGNPSNSIGMPGNLQEASQYRYDTLTKGIYAANQSFIDSIFDSNTEMIGKVNVGTGDHLFNYNPTTGEYYYDSDKNAATYNQQQGRFYVYQGKEYIQDNDGNPVTNFLPFNDNPNNYGSAGKQNTGATNYWFGMKNTIDFYLPNDVAASAATNGSGNKNPVSKDDMIFKFSGDDDVWVFVEELDDEGNVIEGTRRLVLDLGGIHNRAGGFVDFSTGTVTTFKGTIENRQNVVVDETASEALKQVKSGNCRMTVYYLERGSSLSNCSIYFNLMPQPKTLELSKRLEGLTDSERAKYTDEEFTYELIVNGGPYNSTTDERYWAVYYDSATGQKIMEDDGSGHSVVKKRQIIDGKITIKDGETVKIPRLDRFDTFYVAEEKGLNMNQFEVPHAERKYTDDKAIEHEEDVTLHVEHSEVAEVDDWATPRYELENTEKVTFTNTLRETELEVKKIWADAETKTSHPDISFTVEATIDVNGEPVRYKVVQLRDENNSEENEVFTLSTPDGATEAAYLIKRLPVVTPATAGDLAGKEITYTVSEVTVDDYTTTYDVKEDRWDIDVMKLWADSAHNAETVRVKLQRTSDGKYYSGSVNGEATFADSVGFTTLTQDTLGNYVARFEGVPRGDTYKIVQDTDQNQNTTGLVMYKRNVVDHEITNTEDNHKITVIKEWLDADGHPMQTAPQDKIGYTVYETYHEHKWGEWQEKPGEVATETEPGIEIRYCEYDHSHYQERVKAATGHSHDWQITVHDPTCTEQGYTEYHCTKDSSHDYNDNYVPALGHDYTYVDTPATCTEDGVRTYTCSRCDDTYTVTLPALGHDWGKWVPNPDGKTETRTCGRNQQHTETRDISPYTERLPFAPDLPYAPEENLSEILPVPPTPYNQNATASFNPTGVFKLGGKYYIIYDTANKNWNNVWDDYNKTYKLDELKNSGVCVELPDSPTIYDEYTFTQGDHYQSYNGRRNDLRKGDLYHATDGSWYLYIDNASDGMAPPNERWMKLDTGESTVTSSGTNDAGTNGVAQNASRKLSAMRQMVANVLLNAANDAASGQDGSGVQRGDGTTPEFAIPTTLSSLESAYPTVESEGKRTDGNGNYLVVYGNYELKKSEHSDWTMEIKVPKPEDEWSNHHYYVVETDPSTGYTTGYTYEDKNAQGEGYIPSESGIKEEGRVTITNQQKPLETEITVVKTDEKGNPIAGAKFQLTKKVDSEYVKFENDAFETDAENQNKKTGPFTVNSTTGITLKLEPGEYQLEEVKAPEGYVISQKYWTFKIGEDGKLTGNHANGLTISIPNEPGAELPAAGGPGPMLVNILGFTMISAVIFTYVLRGKRQYAYAHATSGRRSARRGTPRRDSRR